MTANQFAHLKPMTQGVQPISLQEREARIEKAQRLMRENHIDALYLEAGTGLVYFTNIKWWPSERMGAAVIPAQGEIAYICPAFEEARLRELMIVGEKVYVWEENESPYKLTSQVFKDFGISKGTIGIEENVRFFLFDGIRKETPHLNFTSADAVTISCRAYKSPAEIALMQRANEITKEAFKACIAVLREGMSQEEFSANSVAAHKALGADGHIDVQFGKSTAFPHGSKEVEYLKEGDVVLMDGQCTVEGYYSDISRTIVFGNPTPRQREIWALEKEAQAAAFAAARLGDPCEAVDAAARAVITKAGFGPGYKVPGLPHRTGHGIGLDVHEWHHVVQGNKTPLAPGLCFSNEPMIAIYGEFGVRLEDCVYMDDDGAHFFTTPSPSIEKPFAD